MGTSGPGGYGPGDPNSGVGAGGAGGGGGGGGSLKVFMAEGAPLGISSRGTKPRPRTELENRARKKADDASDQFRAQTKFLTNAEVLEMALKRLTEDDLEGVRSFVMGKLSGHLWQDVYAEETRSAVDRLADVSEGDSG